ncbi:acyltransferase family protein [Streptomyces afghaniensis]|uniref:acyltransferase family protein n=1 Tax=Streptomyces afghaniensis TaxID=66865 RepID=UPI0027841153|nr:acyltransferase [Streptomyces afghaniensis]MDQ1016557.1 peptidoglycan/LPS O-acetylase OafA/YrhL [Streptomyces afghaniensis]
MPVKNYRTLHGIRGVAALCIVALHSPRLFGTMPGFLGLAVDLFFVLSGFVLAHAYEDRFRQGTTPLTFLRQRWMRLYPLYAVGLLLGIVHQAMCILYDSPTVAWTWTDLLIALPFALFMLPAPLSLAFPFNGPMWSIFFELLANLLWAVFWRPLQSTRVLAGTVVVCGGFYSWALMHWENPGLGLTWVTFPGGLARVGYSFAAGLLIYRLRDKARTPRIPPLVLMGVLPAMAFFRPGLTGQLLSVLFVFPLVVLLGSRSEPGSGTQRVYESLGKASYCVYVLHRPLAALLYAVVLRFSGQPLESFAPWGGFVFMAMLVAGGLVLTDTFETPARRWLTRRLGAKGREPLPAPGRVALPRGRAAGGDGAAVVAAPAPPGTRPHPGP